MSGGITVGSVVASANGDTKVYFVERTTPGQVAFMCPIDGKAVDFAEASISRDAFGEITLSVEPSCVNATVHKWHVEDGQATLAEIT